jgi:hypothetical protein
LLQQAFNFNTEAAGAVHDAAGPLLTASGGIRWFGRFFRPRPICDPLRPGPWFWQEDGGHKNAGPNILFLPTQLRPRRPGDRRLYRS